MASLFEQMKQTDTRGNEYWSAREMQKVLEYVKWQNFVEVLKRAAQACQNSGQDHKKHFTISSKLIIVGKNTKQEVKDYNLTRYACYLVAMNSDPFKKSVAEAQTYFAAQTAFAEQVQQQLHQDPVIAKLLQEIDNLKSQLAQQNANIHVASDRVKAQVIRDMKTVPKGHFSSPMPLGTTLFMLESFINDNLDPKAVMVISTGRYIAKKGREDLHIPESEVIQFPSLLDSGIVVPVRAYPNKYRGDIEDLLMNGYMPDRFDGYAKDRKEREQKKLQSPITKKQIEGAS